MAKYLMQASYGAQGVQGLIQGGGSSRVAAVEALVQQMGGTVEVVYFSFGDSDVIGICDMPDNVSAVAISLAVNASGVINAKVTPLITPEELDAAAKKVPSYTPPG
jgi:uncharacterized protein with GYD domain